MWRWTAGLRLPPNCMKPRRMRRSVACLRSEPQQQALATPCAGNTSCARVPARHTSRQQPLCDRRQQMQAAVIMGDAMRSQQQQWRIAFLCGVSHQTVKNPLTSRATWQRSWRFGQQKADDRPIASRQGDQGDVEYIACWRQQPRRSSCPLCMYGYLQTLPSQLARRMLPFVQQASRYGGCVDALCATTIRLVHHLSRYCVWPG